MIIVDTLIVGRKISGIGSYTINLLNNLSEFIEFEVLTTVPEFFKNCKVRKVPSFILKDRGKIASILRILYIQTLNSKGILYKTYYEPSLFWKGKQIITIHDIIPVIYKNEYLEKFFIYEYIIKRFIKKIDFVFTVSEKSKEDIVNFFNIDENKVKVFYPSYDENFFKPLNLKKENYFLVVGAQFKHKNVEIVIKVMKFFKDFKLIIVGTKKPYENELRNLIKELNLNNVEIMNYVSPEKLIELYSKSLLLLMPSKYEGFGIPVLEAMAVGVPVIGTKAVSEAGGDAIEYADFDNVESWIYAINKVLENREFYIKKGFERINKFSWKRTAKEIAEFIKRFLL